MLQNMTSRFVTGALGPLGALVLILGTALNARQFTIFNRTEGPVSLSGVIEQKVEITPLAGTPTVEQAQASWPNSRWPGSSFVLASGERKRISLPDTPQTEHAMYGTTTYDFTKTPLYTITTSIVIGTTKVPAHKGPRTYLGERPGAEETVEKPVYLTLTLMPKDGGTYAIQKGGKIAKREPYLSKSPEVTRR
jgi:hypothetical protein